MINQGLRLADRKTRIVLIHVIESAGAKVLGQQIHDAESKADE